MESYLFFFVRGIPILVANCNREDAAEKAVKIAGDMAYHLCEEAESIRDSDPRQAAHLEREFRDRITIKDCKRLCEASFL
jgi:hypothetical protein